MTLLVFCNCFSELIDLRQRAGKCINTALLASVEVEEWHDVDIEAPAQNIVVIEVHLQNVDVRIICCDLANLWMESFAGAAADGVEIYQDQFVLGFGDGFHKLLCRVYFPHVRLVPFLPPGDGGRVSDGGVHLHRSLA